MSTMYTIINEVNEGKETIILNRDYSREQIAKELRALGKFSEEFIEAVLEKGIYLEKDLMVQPSNDCKITIQSWGTISCSGQCSDKKDTVIVHSDGRVVYYIGHKPVARDI